MSATLPRSSEGATFVRADLHVHTFPDDPTAPYSFDPGEYIRIAVTRGVAVLGITDHNTTKNVRAMIAAADGHPILVLAGIEVTTHQGHLLALFAPDRVDDLESFATRDNLKLKPDPADQSLRSTRSMLELVDDVGSRGGLAIPAHIDRGRGIATSMPATELRQLIASPALAALEFAEKDSLSWFTTADQDNSRREAIRTRAASALASRTLAFVMSSDAHTAADWGRINRTALSRA
jgi:hypothetical protein